MAERPSLRPISELASEVLSRIRRESPDAQVDERAVEMFASFTDAVWRGSTVREDALRDVLLKRGYEIRALPHAARLPEADLDD